MAKRSTSAGIRHIGPPKVDVEFVEINYESKGRITFFTPLSNKGAAWQRIEWAPNFHKK
jgi:hypothetical protein